MSAAPPAKCKTCKGSGWNQAILDRPVDITAPIGGSIGLKTVMLYLRRRLLCPDCQGTGRQQPVDVGQRHDVQENRSMIATHEAPAIIEWVRAYLARQGTFANATLAARVLNTANSITDILVGLRNTGLRLERHEPTIWFIIDSENLVILAFRLTESRRGVTIDIVRPEAVHGAA